jgi:hypothetical protein
MKNKETVNQKDRAYYLKNKNSIIAKQRELYILKKKKENENYIHSPRKETLYSWKNRESTRKYFETASKLLHISDFSDWYRISRSQIQQTGGFHFHLSSDFSFINEKNSYLIF